MLTRQVRRWGFRLLLADPLTRIYDRFSAQRSLGKRGELLAERFLLKRGWLIVARSHTNEVGEVDLIAVDRRTLVFVEVKTRSSLKKGKPSEAVDLNKQRQIARAAEVFIHRNELAKTQIRFDVISIVWPVSGTPEVEHLMDAFEAPVGIANSLA